MLRDELEKITLQSRNQKEYNEIVEKMKNADRQGKDFIRIDHISKYVVEKLTIEGILIREMIILNEHQYVLNWM